ncbi:MAG TPA: rod shape-determining protein MreD [Candidatus Saccharicenans sp.]|nr:rod shape-determining protein MreD [Candidatus Saccharicenans sp.]
MRIRKGLMLLLILVLAFAVYSLMSKFSPNLLVLINSFWVAVLLTAITYGEIEGAAMGTVAGLLEDAFSHSVFGLSGLSLTITGFLAGWLAQKINLNSLPKRSLILFFFSLLQLVIWIFLYNVIFKRGLLSSRPGLYLQPIMNAIITSLLAELLPPVKKVVD